MNKMTRTALTALLAASALTACEDREISLQLVNIAPLAGTCLAETDDTIFLGNGVVDLALARDYVIFARVVNNMIDITTVKQYSNVDARLDTNDVVLSAAIVEFSALDQVTANLPERVKVPLAGTVQLGGEGAVIPLQLLSPSMLQELRSSQEFRNFDAQNNLRPIRGLVKIIAKLRLQGNTLDGKKIESNEFLFPIDVCNGCRVTFPSQVLAVDQGSGALFCLSPNELGPDTDLPDPPVCPNFVGTDNTFVDCVSCRGFAVDAVAAQLCNPAISP